MKLLMITQKVNPSDANLGFAYYWVKEIGKHLEALFVICLDSAVTGSPENVFISTISPQKETSRIRKVLNFYKESRRILKKEKLAGVFVHQCPIYAILIYPLAKLKKLPIVLWYTHGHVSMTLRIAGKLVTTILTATKESCRLASSKIKIIGHGIDMERFFKRNKSEEAGEGMILSIGRIAPVKDYETLIKSIHYLVKDCEMSSIKAEIIGDIISGKDKEYFELLKKQVKSYGLDEHIAFRGAVSHEDIYAYYAKSELVISTSRTGSLDKVLVEAMASGKPVITSLPVQGLFGKYADMLMYKAGDHVELAEKIRDLLHRSRLELDQMGDDLRKIAEEKHGLKKLAMTIINEFA